MEKNMQANILFPEDICSIFYLVAERQSPLKVGGECGASSGSTDS
jgi:hypothetical protein